MEDLDLKLNIDTIVKYINKDIPNLVTKLNTTSTNHPSRADISLSKIPDPILEKFNSIIETLKLPHDLKISTMTVTCNFDCQFNIVNIGKFLPLTKDNIYSIKFGNDPADMRCIDPNFGKKIKKKKKKNKVKKMFYNQATIKIITKYKVKPTNVKLFKNGAIQMTGCISIENALQVLRVLCNSLLENIYTTKTLGTQGGVGDITLVDFVSNREKLDVLQVRDFKINMINSNLNIGYKVDRAYLYQILLKRGVECTYEPCVHACVNLRYSLKKVKNKKLSIFIFESGAVIITGATNNDHLIEAHSFITKILCENYNVLVKRDIEDFLRLDVIKELMKEKK